MRERIVILDRIYLILDQVGRRVYVRTPPSERVGRVDKATEFNSFLESSTPLFILRGILIQIQMGVSMDMYLALLISKAGFSSERAVAHARRGTKRHISTNNKCINLFNVAYTKCNNYCISIVTRAKSG